MKNIISITDSAANQIKHLLTKEANAIGIRVSVELGGCSGNKYKFEYVKKQNKHDEEVIDKEVRIFIDTSAIFKIFGTVLDYTDEKVKSGFIFINPNEKGQCGCGESFYL